MRYRIEDSDDRLEKQIPQGLKPFGMTKIIEISKKPYSKCM